MDSLSGRKLIENCLPQLKIRQSRLIVTGWENLVLEVNREHIFRFPKCKETEKRLRNEIAILPTLSRQLSVQVPNYDFIWKGGPKYQHWFGGYRKISGITVGSSRFRKECLKPLAAQIADCLKQLHRVRLKSNRFPDMPVYSPKEWLEATRGHRRKIRKIVYPLLNSKLRASKV